MNYELLELLNDKQREEIGEKVKEKILKAVEDIDTVEVTKKFEEALLDTDFYYDNIDLEEVSEKLNEIVVKSLDNFLKNARTKSNK